MRGEKNLQGSCEPGTAVKWLRRAVVAMAALFPFILFPGIERPFSTPKIILLGAFVVIAGSWAVGTGNYRLPELPRWFRLSLIAWPSALIASAVWGKFVSPEALWLSLFSLGWFLLVMAVRPGAGHLAVAVAASCAVTAAIALLQYSGLDPFGLFGWKATAYGSPRMRVLGTLGNPNFVAALLVAGLALTVPMGKLLARRAVYCLMIALQAAAVFATGSRAAVAALIAVLVWWGSLGPFPRWRLAAAALIMIALLPLMPSRPLLNTIEGRFYIWRITAAHLLERPLFGFGPGAFEPKFIEWETRYWLEGRGTADERRYSGLQAHAHNDYLETLVDGGLAALLSLWLLLGSFLAFAFQKARHAPGGLLTGASAGVVALAAVAMVDFPFHRPAELFLVWTLMALVFLQAGSAVGGCHFERSAYER